MKCAIPILFFVSQVLRVEIICVSSPFCEVVIIIIIIIIGWNSLSFVF
jgi:hypothetical protein